MRGVGPHKDGNALGANVSNGCGTELLITVLSELVLYWFINVLKFSAYYISGWYSRCAECVSVFCMMPTIQRDYLPKHY